LGRRKTQVVSKSNNRGVVDFQVILQGLYEQLEKPNKERNFMLLAKKWIKSEATQEVSGQRLKNNAVYRFERSAPMVDDGVSSQSEASNLHVILQDLYEHVDQSEMEQAYIELAEEWNVRMMECEEEEECEDPQILTVLNEIF